MLFDVLHPLTWAIALLAGALACWKRTRLSRGLCLAALLVLAVFGSEAGSGRLVRSLEGAYPDREAADYPTAQAIVVLGGSIHIPGGSHLQSSLIDPSDRILEGFRLYRAGRAPLVVCVGGGWPDGVSEAETMGRLLEEWGVPASAIVLEPRSHSTRENAVYSREILQGKGIQRILLVSSAAHLRRAEATFRKVGFDVIPAAADYHSGWGTGSGLAGWLPEAGRLSQSDGALKEWAGFWVYRWRGWE